MDPITLIMAVASLGLGLASGLSGLSQSEEQAKAQEYQATQRIAEREKQVKQLINQQKTSFLKSGVYFSGTPQAVFNESYDTAMQDINAIANDSNTKISALRRQGKTAFYSSLLKGLTSAGTSLVGGDFFNNINKNPKISNKIGDFTNTSGILNA